jgi:hypothetical protein
LHKKPLQKISTCQCKHEVFHNTFLPAYCNTLNAIVPAQGTGDRQRIGDRIFVKGVNIKIMFGPAQKGDRPNVNWRVFIFSTPAGGSLLAALFSNPVLVKIE